MLSNHLIHCCLLLHLPSVFPNAELNPSLNLFGHRTLQRQIVKEEKRDLKSLCNELSCPTISRMSGSCVMILHKMKSSQVLKEGQSESWHDVSKEPDEELGSLWCTPGATTSGEGISTNTVTHESLSFPLCKAGLLHPVPLSFFSAFKLTILCHCRIQESPYSPHFCQHSLSCLLDDDRPNRCEVIVHCGFGMHFPNGEWCSASFHVLLAICLSSLEKFLLNFYAHLKVGFLYYFIGYGVSWVLYTFCISTPYPMSGMHMFYPISQVAFWFLVP